MGTLEIQWAWNFLKIAGNLNRTFGVEFKPAWRKIPKQNYFTTRFWLCPLQDFIYFFQNKTNNQCENNEKEFEALSEIEKCFVDSPKISFIETREKRFDKKCWDL